MNDPLQALLGADAVPQVSFAPTSRYARVGIAHFSPPAGPDGPAASIPHLRRRLVPAPERFPLHYEYACVEGDRRDRVAATHLGDAELWWRIADANGVIDPADLTEPVGRRLRVTGEETPHG